MNKMTTKQTCRQLAGKSAGTCRSPPVDTLAGDKLGGERSQLHHHPLPVVMTCSVVSFGGAWGAASHWIQSTLQFGETHLLAGTSASGKKNVPCFTSGHQSTLQEDQTYSWGPAPQSLAPQSPCPVGNLCTGQYPLVVSRYWNEVGIGHPSAESRPILVEGSRDIVRAHGGDASH